MPTVYHRQQIAPSFCGRVLVCNQAQSGRNARLRGFELGIMNFSSGMQFSSPMFIPNVHFLAAVYSGIGSRHQAFHNMKGSALLAEPLYCEMPSSSA